MTLTKVALLGVTNNGKNVHRNRRVEKMKHPPIKLLEYKYPEGLGDGEFTLQIKNQTYHIRDILILNGNAPEGNYFHIVKPNSEKLIYQNCKKVKPTPYYNEQHELLNAVLNFGTIATIARKLQGYKIEETGEFFNTFINDDGEKQAIVYPYPEMAWSHFKQTYEAHREKFYYETVIKELKEKGFKKNEDGNWIQKQKPQMATK